MISTDTCSLDRFSPISLEEVQQDSAFLTRTDRKYLIPVERVESFLDALDPDARVLTIDGRRCFSYWSPYFDDEQRTSYLGGLRRRPNRFKVRTRLYCETGLCQLEVKVYSSRGQTIKHRVEHDAAELADLSNGERDWLDDFPQIGQTAPDLRHCLTTTYQRSTLVLPAGTGRVTIDRDVTFSAPGGDSVATPGWAIIETKGAGRPTTADLVLWRLGYRPVPMSKFAVGTSLLHPELPANRWHRVRGMLAFNAHELAIQA